MKFAQKGYSLVAENQNLNGKENCSKNELWMIKNSGEVKAVQYHVSSGRYFVDYLNPADGKVHEVFGFEARIGMIPDYLVAAGKKAQVSAHLDILEVRLPRNFPITVIHSSVDKSKITAKMSRVVWSGMNQSLWSNVVDGMFSGDVYDLNEWKEPYPHTSVKKFAWYPFASISDTDVQSILYFDPGFLLPLVEKSADVVRGKSAYSRIGLNEAIIEFKKVNKTEPSYRIYQKVVEGLAAKARDAEEQAEAAARAKQEAENASNQNAEAAERERSRNRHGTIGVGYDVSTGRVSPVLNIGGRIGISVGRTPKTYVRIGGSSYVR
jgi:hypothetical protein